MHVEIVSTRKRYQRKLLNLQDKCIVTQYWPVVLYLSHEPSVVLHGTLYYRTGNVLVNVTLRRCNHCCRAKTRSITYSECVSVASVIQHPNRMRRIVLLSVTCLAVVYFSTLSHKARCWGEKLIEHKIYVLILSANFV